jgi:hypothetical protein
VTTCSGCWRLGAGSIDAVVQKAGNLKESRQGRTHGMGRGAWRPGSSHQQHFADIELHIWNRVLRFDKESRQQDLGQLLFSHNVHHLSKCLHSSAGHIRCRHAQAAPFGTVTQSTTLVTGRSGATSAATDTTAGAPPVAVPAEPCNGHKAPAASRHCQRRGHS